MIDALLAFCLRQRTAVVALSMVLAVAGVVALRDTPVDALPDLGENQVLVHADWMGRGPREVQDQVTRPLTTDLQGLPGVTAVRATSMPGVSMLTVVFGDEVPRATARQAVSERLGQRASPLPEGVAPRLGPDATGLGWIYQYTLHVESPPAAGTDLAALRDLQDRVVGPRLRTVPGVADVGGVGGFQREIQVEVDPLRMRGAGVRLDMVMMAVRRASLDVGGGTLEENGMEFTVRGLGTLRDAAALAGLPVMTRGDTVVRLRDVAEVTEGGAERRGVLDVGGHEAVGGTVVMRSGADARAVLRAVRARVEEINRELPAGIRVRGFYDRGGLIDRTLRTLRSALVEEIVLVVLAHLLFLRHLRSVLIVSLPLPLAVLGAFLLMRLAGQGSNLMSLGGIAIAIGVLVDAGIVITENVLRHAARAEAERGRPLSPAERLDVVRHAAAQVGRPVLFAMAVILLAFLPVFALGGQEGRLFRPMALTKTFATAVATALAVTLVPVLCTFWARGPFHAEEDNRLMRGLLRVYDPLLRAALRHSRTVVTAAAALLVGALALAPRLGREFMPPFREDGLLFMPVLAPSTALTEIRRVMAWQDQVLASFPEVASAVGKLGRADTATDPAPAEMIETTITLRPESDWRPGMTRERLVAEMTSALSALPGCVPGFVQPIEGRVLMMSTGIRAALGVKIFGEDLDALQAAAARVQRVVQSVPGAVGVSASRTQGKAGLDIEVDRDAAAAVGLTPGDVLDTVETGLAGMVAAEARDGARRVPVRVRFARAAREDLTRLADLPVTTPSGRAVSLGDVARLTRRDGPSEIATEDGQPRAFVQAGVAGRDLAGFVEEVRRRLDAEVAPGLAAQGMRLAYAGEYEHRLRAARALRQAVPVALVLIFLLLRRLWGSAAEAAHVLLAVPFALTGGLALQAALGWKFSVAVWVGYLALLGTAIQTAVVMVTWLREAVERKRAARGPAFSREDLTEAVLEGARLRLRPKVMTVATVVAGLLPVLWSDGAGAEVMKPLAAPVVGGMLSSLVHVLIVTPALFLAVHGRGLPARRP